MRTRIQSEDHLISLTDALLYQVEVKDIISGRLFFDAIDCRDAAELIFRLEDRYKLHSHMECERICEEISDRISKRDRMRMRLSKRGHFHVFELLGDLSERLLVYQNDVVLCHFDQILSWRELVNNLGEELPLAVMYVIQDMARGRKPRNHFSWSFVTRHDNNQLHQIMQKGISDHHFHLWPSGPYFHLSWINLMNHVVDGEYVKNLQELDERRRIIKTRRPEEVVWQEKTNVEESLTLLQLQAALIRLYLWGRLNNVCFNTDGFAARELCGDACMRYLMYIKGAQCAHSPKIYLVQNDCHRLVYCPDQQSFTDAEQQYSIDFLLSEQRILNHSRLLVLTGEELNLSYVTYLLQNPLSLRMASTPLQNMINSVLAASEFDDKDYALYPNIPVLLPEFPYSYLFTGERRFLYQMLRDIYLTYPRLSREEHNLFYAYLCIQIKLRREMIQTNKKVGFDNFAAFQDTKDYFLGDEVSLKRIAQLAIFDPLEQLPHLQELEVRLTPKATELENRDLIRRLDRAVADCVRHSERDLFDETCLEEILALQNRYYYIFHFPKKADPEIHRLRSTDYVHHTQSGFECRHSWYRHSLSEKATAISNFRKNYPEIASRVHGIDACSQEIGCRPEVFAPSFRRLNGHTSYRGDLLERIPLPQLRITYHVGEDFLDIVDGMRAIDEAIRFINLGCGDRLGHAIALGMDPLSWYEAKGFRITLMGQDYLDNLAWIHHALQRYQIENCESYLREIESTFDFYFHRFYLSHINEADIKKTMIRAVQYYEDINLEKAKIYTVHNCRFTIDDYYRAWTLRGDDPSLYQLGFFQKDTAIPELSTNWNINENDPESNEARYIPECAILYSYYHYNQRIKQAGTEHISVQINPEDVERIAEVQSKMRYDIADKRLAVECNPTSNVKIGAFRRYQSHPISTFYNIGLVHSDEEMRRCAQMNVSINTDDQGVFFTSIENEFAVMTRAMEIAEDNKGKTLYQEWEVADWINHIREQGNRQGF